MKLEIGAHQGSRGFTLVEVMVATYILSVVFASLFGAMAQGMKMMDFTRDLTRVSQILQSEMEDLRTLNWNELEDLRDNKALQFYSAKTHYAGDLADRYRVYRWVLPHPVHSSEMIRVRIYVMWTVPGRGGQQWRILSTDFTKNGLNDYYYRNV